MWVFVILNQIKHPYKTELFIFSKMMQATYIAFRGIHAEALDAYSDCMVI